MQVYDARRILNHQIRWLERQTGEAGTREEHGGDPAAELLKLRPLVLASGSDRLLGIFNQLYVAALRDVERND